MAKYVFPLSAIKRLTHSLNVLLKKGKKKKRNIFLLIKALLFGLFRNLKRQTKSNSHLMLKMQIPDKNFITREFVPLMKITFLPFT